MLFILDLSDFYLFIFLAVLGLELRAFTLSHSAGPLFIYLFFCEGFFRDRVSQNYVPKLALNCDPPDLCLLSS
jgi:hypothetical protein